MRTSQTLASAITIMALVLGPVTPVLTLATPTVAFADVGHFHDGHGHDGDTSHHDGDSDHEHDGSDDSSDDSSDTPTVGSITVCKIIVDTEGDTRTNSPLPAVTMTVAGGVNGAFVLPDTTFVTPLETSMHFLDVNVDDDAACTTYSDLALGEYHYGEETLSSDADYDEPLFNDQYDTPVHAIADFYQYMAANNQNADGSITLTAARPDRTLVVLNTYTAGDPAPVDVCANIDGDQAEVPSGDVAVGDQCNPIAVPPTDVCSNVTGDQAAGPCADTLCVAPATWNTDTQACVAPVVETGGGGGDTPAPAAILGGGPLGGFGGGTIGGGNGQVLGVSCGVYLNKFVRFGYKNDKDQVTKLQEFLNSHESAGLTVSGMYDQATLAAVKAFQSKYADDILSPWKLHGATGIVYKTTLRHINNLQCPGLMPEMPALTPWSE